MSLFRLKTASVVLIEDNENVKKIPLILEIAPKDTSVLHLISYEQPIDYWKHVFKDYPHVQYHEDFKTTTLGELMNEKCSVFIDSINQMVLCMGWKQCLLTLKKLISSSNVSKLILCLHTDCLLPNSKLRLNLNHMANAIITFNLEDISSVNILYKKSGKVLKSKETMVYDLKTSNLTLTPVVADNKVEAEAEKILPQNLSTFKIEVDQTEKLEKYKLKLPYMSKINHGESKIFYEPDAVDDWDEEDPDDDLDI